MPLISKEELQKYKHRVIVAGSRSFEDKGLFLKLLNDFVLYTKSNPTNTAFISGGASHGPDALIIRWAIKYGWPYCVFPADWKRIEGPKVLVRRNDQGELYNALAGHNRNQDMAYAATHLFAIWDTKSPGTKDMIKRATDLSLNVHLAKVPNHGKPKNSTSK